MTHEYPGGATGRLIAQALRQEILDGILQPGERIAQEAIAQRFDASRIPVREGLRMLEAEGLITIVPNSGAWVAKLDLVEFGQIYLLRESVESLAVRMSIDHLRPEQVERLRELVDEIAAADDVETFLRVDREFHLSTYAGAQFPLLHEMVDRFWNSTQHYRRVFAATSGRERHWATDAEHGLIVDAIARRDRDTAAALVSAHIRRTRLRLSEHPELFQNP
ncbi:GntR family transcriptional regulator [Protaetiibacter sp. SSC-01]|uniref:GntR family transcriptional regulator n=1 Tax=Protaetiibacter sp. SSC-01 TaxID=2759943 RepID=UPI0016572544|nr:GntR family transcriptional regulator [Protaetiibacter sp. SSC-01]QNO38308.1 GntR family transcriptional regulator [Protaetiibacter sp. SSC-01]